MKRTTVHLRKELRRLPKEIQYEECGQVIEENLGIFLQIRA